MKVIINYGILYKNILSIFLSMCMIFGYSYSRLNNWNMIFQDMFQFTKSLIVAFGYYIIFKGLINYIFNDFIKNIKYKESKSKIFNFIFEKHSFLIPLIIILICWLPYIIIYFPGVLAPDSSNQIKQFFGIQANGSTDSVKLIDENVKITNHHPILHTVVLGSCVKLGEFIGSDNIGIFIYSIIQMIILASSFAYIICNMRKLRTPNWIRIITLGIISIIPVFPFHSIEIVKDIIFTALIMIYLMQLYLLINNKEKKYTFKKMIFIFVLLLLICLMRNNGLYLVIMSFPLLAIIDKINRKSILAIFFAVVLIFKLYTSILLPALKISPSSVREMLSIPFQQTARYVKEYPDEVTEEEKRIIDKILNYETLAKRYVPVHADSVKNQFNKDATSEDLGDYFKVWFKQFLRHPTVYFQATINNTYGYFYPECKIKEYGLFRDDYCRTLEQTGEGKFNYKYLEQFSEQRKFINNTMDIIQNVPVISWITNIGLNTWIILGAFVYILYIKEYKYLIYMMPLMVIILTDIISPVNNVLRYSLPYIFSMPLTISILIHIESKRRELKL